MFPIYDDVPRLRTPVWTWTLILVNVLVFVYASTLSSEQHQALFTWWGIVPRHVAEASAAAHPLARYAPLVTSQFLHAGPLHLIVNMWTLWIFGDNVEDRMGGARFVVFYLLCGVVAGIAHVLANPLSDVPTIGASGAIAGVLGAYLVLFPRARVIMLVPIFFYPLFFELPAFVYLAAWFLGQIWSGASTVAAADARGGGVAWWAHVGGFAAGILLFWVFLERKREGGDRSPDAGL